MTLGFSDLRKGVAIELDGEPYSIVEYERSKMQKRAPVMRVRFRSLRTGKIIDRNFTGFDVKLTPASVEQRSAQYLYQDGGLFYFMDTNTFDQLPLSESQVKSALPYLTDRTIVDIVFYKEEPISLELPLTVDLSVSDTGPSFKGNTAQGGTKPATLETGLEIQVPLFVQVGDSIKVDTRSSEYLSRL